MNTIRKVRAFVPTSLFYALFTFLLLVVVAPLLGRGLTAYTFQSVSQSLANALPLALAIGITMMVGEFDTSVVATFSLGAMIVVQMASSGQLALGFLAVLLAAVVIGLIQGLIVTRFNISSVPVTVGGFLVIWGITNLLAGGKQVTLNDDAARRFFTDPVLGPVTTGALIVIVVVLIIAFFTRFTVVGTIIHAVGSDRRASRISGVRVGSTLVGAFIAAAVIAGLGGAMYGLSFGNASPDVGFAPIVAAVIAAVLGGAGVPDRRGAPVAILFGVLTLAFLHEALLASRSDPNYTSVVTGAFLIIIATFGSGEITRRFRTIRMLRERQNDLTGRF